MFERSELEIFATVFCRFFKRNVVLADGSQTAKDISLA